MINLFSTERRRQAGHWLGELLVVVLGVLIALYAQQWASDIASFCPKGSCSGYSYARAGRWLAAA